MTKRGRERETEREREKDRESLRSREWREGRTGMRADTGESEGWRYDGITEREREAVEGKEKRIEAGMEPGEIAVD